MKTAAVVSLPLLAAIAAIAAGPALAQAPQAVGTFRDWSVFVREVEGDTVCFAATAAKEKSPKSVNHGDIFFLVATWKSGQAANQPSVMLGYNLKDASAPTVKVGGQSFSMYASENEAFIESASTEKALIEAMKKGADMKVSATSSRGTTTGYTFSLTGISAALDRVAQSCR